MITHLIKSSEQTTTAWSGGTTTELYIYPKSASYSERKFDFRLSTARVDVRESTFTPLPGIHRKLLVLEGSIELNHSGHHTQFLEALDLDIFEGDWNTACLGKCIDFNLMLQGKTTGEPYGLKLFKAQTVMHSIEQMHDFIFVYAFSGNLLIDPNSDAPPFELFPGDLLVIQDSAEQSKIKLTGNKDSVVVITTIRLAHQLDESRH